MAYAKTKLFPRGKPVDGGDLTYELIRIAEGITTAGTPTVLSLGTINATTMSITSDGSVNDVTLIEATTGDAGLLGAAKWDEIVANTLKATNVSTALSLGTRAPTTLAITSDGGADDVTLPEADTTNAGLLGADKWDEIVANTLKATNVSTELSAGTVNATTYGITSDGGVDDIVLPEADTDVAGLLGADKWDEIVANTLKETNVSTALELGTVNATTVSITSDGSADDVTLAEADTDVAGLLGADKWDEIVANTVHKGSDGSDHSKVNANETAAGLNTTHRGLVAGNPHVVTPAELSLVIGTNVLAQQAIGITDNYLVEVDGSPADDEYAKWTAAGLEGRSYANVKTDLSLNNVSNIKDKVDATAAPDADNDTTEGYSVGSRWIDVTNDKIYFCLDATDTAAVWSDGQAAYDWKGAWATATGYVVNDCVENDGSGYVCKLAHTSGDTDDEPGSGATWTTYWDIFSQGGKLTAGEGIDINAGVISGENATDTNKGILETATNTEAVAGTSTDKALVPANLALWFEHTGEVHIGTTHTVTTSAADIPNLTTGALTYTVDSYVFVTVTMDCRCVTSTADTMYFWLVNAAGTGYTSSYNFKQTATTRTTISATYRVAVTAGSRTIKVKGDITANTGSAYSGHSRMTWWSIPQ